MPSRTIVGHDHVITKLERIFSSPQRPHAFLFSGSPSGIGKRTVAMRFFMTLFCESAQKPCSVCASCRQIADQIHPDFLAIYPDEKGNIPIGDPDKKEAGSVRWLISMMNARPVTGKRAVLIDGIDGASISAQNALLKSIEEPSEGTLIIMTTCSEGNILRTILSRSTVVRFSPIPFDTLFPLLDPSKNGHAECEFAAIASGGSVERSVRFLDEKLRSALILFCRALIDAAKGKTLQTEAQALLSSAQGDAILDGSIALFSFLLREPVRKQPLFNTFVSELNIDGVESLRKIIKLLLFVKKGGSRNLNPVYALKGALYGGETDPFYERLMIY